MIRTIHRYSKAIAAGVAPAAVFVADVALEVSKVTEDGFVDGYEYRLLGVGVITALVTALAPRNRP